MNGDIAKANGIEIWYQTFGDRRNKPLLLIMGGCCQGVLWHRAFCERLAHEGFYVIRYDHRDTGLSTCLDFEKSPYDAMEMAKDALGLLDHLAIEKAGLFGVSLGAFIAEIMAGHFYHRVKSILLLGSTCEIRPMNLAYAGKGQEEGLLPPPHAKYLEWMQGFMNKVSHTHEEKVAQRMEGWISLSGYQFPLDDKINREMQEEYLSRLRHPKAFLNHVKMLKTPQAEELVRSIPSKIQVRAVILHGSEDPIFPPEHGIELSRKIPHSEYRLVEGMGHIPSDHFYDLYCHSLKSLCGKQAYPM